MTAILYYPDEVEADTPPGTTILQTSLQCGIPHTHVCGGNARCSTCRVVVLQGLEHCHERNEKERALADRLQFDATIRLACQTTFDGPVAVRRLVLDEEDIELVNQLRKGATPTAVGEEKGISILFADIRGFTTFAESVLPYDTIHVLNRYFHLIGPIITEHGGFINNYMGDGIMALFGVDGAEDAAERSIAAGLEMLAVVDNKLKPYLEATYRRMFDIGVGIHFGVAVVGSIGAADNKVMTAIGDPVNFASRIESANKDAGTRLLVSEDTYHQVRERVRVGRSVNVSVKGKTGQYALFEITGWKQ